MKEDRKRIAWLAAISLVIIVEGAALSYPKVAPMFSRKDSTDHLLRFEYPAGGSSRVETKQLREGQVYGLTFDRAEYFSLWPEHAPQKMEALCLEYNAGNKDAYEELLHHSPEVCMANSGANIQEVYPPQDIQIHGENLILTSIRVKEEGVDGYIFKAIWFPSGKFRDFSHWRKYRLLRAFSIRAKPPGTAFMASVFGISNREEAVQLFIDESSKFLKIVPVGGNPSPNAK